MWTKTQLIERGVEIVPLRDPSLCDEWVLRSEADKRIAKLEAALRDCREAAECTDSYWLTATACANVTLIVKRALGGDDDTD